MGGAGVWRLCVIIKEELQYSLTAADILDTPMVDYQTIIPGMDGHLEAIYFDPDSYLKELVSCTLMPWAVSMLSLNVAVPSVPCSGSRA